MKSEKHLPGFLLCFLLCAVILFTGACASSSASGSGSRPSKSNATQTAESSSDTGEKPRKSPGSNTKKPKNASHNDYSALPHEIHMKVDTVMGKMTYYNQRDPRWADKYYGGHDRIARSGCGPTAIAMLTSLTGHRRNPYQVASWARREGYWYSHSGSSHDMIAAAARHYGLSSYSLAWNGGISRKSIRRELKRHHLLVILVGEGHFTDGGHFMIITRYAGNNRVCIADPISVDHTKSTWKISLLIHELKEEDSSGGPVWVIRKK